MKTKTMNLAGLALLCAAIFTGCSKSDNEQFIETDRAAIQLSAGLRGTVSRAVVSEGDNFKAGVGGWETENAIDYSQTVAWETTASIVASSTDANIKLDKGQFYNSPNTTYMKAWYPTGTINAGVVTFNGSDYSNNGSVDVMLAHAVSGSVNDKGIKNLVFEHMLTQLKFVVVGDASYAGQKLKSISIADAKVPTGINLIQNSVTYEAGKALPIPGIDMQVLTDTEKNAGGCVMIEPFSGNTFSVSVVTVDASGTETTNTATITIDKDDNFVAGRAYTILLAFGKPGINASASVTPWTAGTGSGSID